MPATATILRAPARTCIPPQTEIERKIAHFKELRYDLARRVRDNEEAWLMPFVQRFTDELAKLETQQDLLFQILADGQPDPVRAA